VNRASRVLLVLAASVAGMSAVWLALPSTPVATAAESGKVLYYQNPDGLAEYSAKPKSTSDGRAFRAVREGDGDTPVKPLAAAQGEKKIKYYRNPMGLPDVSKTPKKDSMGMDYIPVYDGEQDDGGGVSISPAKMQRLGVATEKASMRVLSVPVRAPGTIQLDERRVSVVSVRAEGFVDTVENVTTGMEVKRGQPLLRLYSPAVASAAAEYLSVFNSKIGPAAISGARQRLLNLSVSPDVIAEIESSRVTPLTFTWTAPRDGVVLERNVVDGQRVMPGDVLFRVADHSVVWAMVDVPERNLAVLAEGQKVILKTSAYGLREFPGVVALVYPHLNPATRSARVRIELKNDDLALLPDMYVEAAIDTETSQPAVSVSESALIDSGSRQIVIVDKGGGRFDPRNVKAGRHGNGYVEITEGIRDGDTVVTSANFLIDAESNLKSALQAITGEGAAQ